MITIATHWIPIENERGLEARETRRFGSLSAAHEWARAVLGELSVTADTYWRDLGRAGHVELTTRDGRRGLVPAGQVEPRVRLVASVGERGVW